MTPDSLCVRPQTTLGSDAACSHHKGERSVIVAVRALVTGWEPRRIAPPSHHSRPDNDLQRRAIQPRHGLDARLNRTEPHPPNLSGHRAGMWMLSNGGAKSGDIGRACSGKPGRAGQRR